MMAAWSGVLLQPLLRAGADINLQNADSVSALMLLAQAGDTHQITLAVNAGADAKAKDREGRSAVDYLRAASCGKAIVPLPTSSMRVIASGQESFTPNTVASKQAPQLC